ncbi:primosomal protein N' (replication factor Y) - superfamily II helicase [Tabrizicola sp.]|uniref:primosomal protein N' (replication factor Y) - superfamily II helicase n=1 Tax=Tabrizicola sp. TaxID=2005166 RepID=UPI003F35D689
MAQEEYRWPCAQCGAQLRYAPGQTSLTCEHCGHVQKIAPEAPRARARALQELDLKSGLRDELADGDMVEVRLTSCPSCGAKVEITGATHATECPFCATPVVLDTGTERHIKPQALVPFVLTEAEARKAMITWMGSLWFAPGTLLEYARKGRAMNGVYVPFWTFDADTASSYTGQRGEHYYETRTVTVQVNGKSERRQEQVQRTRWYPASGRVSRNFDDVIVMGSKSLPPRLGNELTPWDLGALVSYTPDYLAGFQAEGYTITLSDGHAEARERMSDVIRGDVRDDIGGDEQRIHGIDTDWSDETFKHILLPVWMAAYKYNGKSYRFLVNGQTGEVQGERPWSIWKIAFAVIIVAAVVLAAVYLSDPEALNLPRPDWMN